MSRRRLGCVRQRHCASPRARAAHASSASTASGHRTPRLEPRRDADHAPGDRRGPRVRAARATVACVVARARGRDRRRADADDRWARDRVARRRCIGFHGRRGFFERTVDAAQRSGIDHELLDAAEIERASRRSCLAGDERGYYEPQAGLLRSEACVAAQLAAAAAAWRAAALRRAGRAPPSTGSGVRIESARGASMQRTRCSPAAPGCRPCWGAARGSAASPCSGKCCSGSRPTGRRCTGPRSMPVFIRLHGAAGDGCYGLPMADAHPGVKIAAEQPSGRPRRTPSSAASPGPRPTRCTSSTCAGALHGIRNVVVHATTCLYTSTPDGRFVVDRHPELERVTVVSACSGHGFKHSAALGEAVAARLLGREPGFDWSHRLTGLGDRGMLVAGTEASKDVVVSSHLSASREHAAGVRLRVPAHLASRRCGGHCRSRCRRRAGTVGSAHIT